MVRKLDTFILLTKKNINDISSALYYFEGKVIRCQLTIHEERKQIKMFHRTFKNAIRVINTQFFNNFPQEVSETFYCANGKMILHYWHDFNYLLHETKGFTPIQEPILPKMEIVWRNNNLLFDKYRLTKELNYENAMSYFGKHPELSDFLQDYINNVIKYKPRNVLEFTVRFFQKFKIPPNTN